MVDPSDSTHYTCTGDVSGGAIFLSGNNNNAPHYQTLDVNSLTTDIAPASGTPGIELTTHGANGSDGSNGDPPSSAGHSSAAHDLAITYVQPGANLNTAGSGAIIATGASGIYGFSRGGDGGDGGDSTGSTNGRGGTPGSAGGAITITATGAISSTGNENPAIVALSVGGKGGHGGNSSSGSPGDGGDGGAGGDVTVNVNATLVTSGSDSDGINAISRGGNSGSAGNCTFSFCGHSSAGDAARGGTVQVTTSATTSITTNGQYANGIYAASIGGFGGTGESNAGFVAYGGGGGSAGPGGTVIVNNAGTITTLQDGSYGIFAQSIGGGGGGGGSSGGVVSVGGHGSPGGAGGDVTVTNAATGTIVTMGDGSIGIFAQSIGGGGGDGGNSGGVSSVGGNGSGTSNGGIVTIDNAGGISTHGTFSQGIFAQSIGGGGGNGGKSAGLQSLGGSGGGGGDGDVVSVTNRGVITTVGNNSQAILVQSIGGGGGNGGASAAQFSVGGSGGNGGDGKTASLTNSGNVSTQGADSSAIFVQSVGGGGGNGGSSVAASVNPIDSISHSVGGKGGVGGTGGVAELLRDGSNTAYSVVTAGERSAGVVVQSVGGGGGNGGMAIALSDGGQYSSSSAIGGSGGAGGNASAVTVQTAGTVATSGGYSDGVFAQSVGGGGGNGGMAISVSGNSAVSASVAIGGNGGSGGNSDTVNVSNWSTITTAGQSSNGIVAQSVGGGGGNGGYAYTLSAGGFAVGVGLGGKGAHGGSSGAVIVDNIGAITTTGTLSDGIFAQSVGGGGGNGGSSVSMAGGAGAVSLAIGGAAGGGNHADTVDLTNSGAIATSGDHSVGIFAQSVGGGGGNGGFAVSGSGGVMSAAIAIGGSGGAGSYGDAVTVGNTGNITTAGAFAYGIQAQSIGGGGGNGGFALSGAVGVQVDDVPGGAVAISIGGKGGGASNAGAVTLDNTGNIATSGANAHALFAQSVGGGGGSGGFAGSVAMTIGTGASFGVAVGGGGSGGGNAGAVQVTSGTSLNANTITTHGDGANGIFAQSVGGGGGDGGFAFAGTFGFGGETSVDVSVAIGGAGGAGGTASTVQVDNYSTITTSGIQSNGIFAQSVGGGGGNGGMAISGTLNFGSGSGNTAVSVGGGGGDGGTASAVTVNNFGHIATSGMDAIGIFAQSVGGSGGNGGMALTTQMTSSTQSSASVAVAVGGGGGNGNAAGTVDVINAVTGTINTTGFGAHGIQAQSVGGGGGNGGLALTAQLGVTGTMEEESKTLNVGIAVGGAGGDGGTGNTVHVVNNGAINVTGDTAMGIFAQSVGGGGGNGGGAISAFGLLTDSSNTSQRALNVNVAIGGAGGNGNNGGAVTVDNTASITTHGVSGYGIFAQSVGGGGGIGGRANAFSFALTNACTICDSDPNAPGNNNIYSMMAAVGGNGGGASNGGVVTVINTGRIETFGDTSDGIYAQSVGGGGGNGGNGTLGLSGLIPYGDLSSYIGTISGAKDGFSNLEVAVGGNNGSSGDGGIVSVDNNKDIVTHGAHSNAITAQSVGGGGGFGGNAAAGDTGSIGLGGQGGAGGNGGAVTVNQHGGATIETFGLASYGIYAQSVGGGGGSAGSSDQIATPTINSFGSASIPFFHGGIGVSPGGGNGGDGGAVQVSADGTIKTHGDNAFGIFAQSVGGGGGVSGNLNTAVQWHVGSNGDAGNAGQVDVTLSGSIFTSGNNAAGIIAQSAGGQGTAGNVNVTLSNSVVTGAILAAQDGTAAAPLRGLGSIGIYAQSVASNNANNGDITISLNSSSGLVQGGRTLLTGPTTGSVGVGIWLQDGRNNTVTNHGTVTTVSGVDGGYAILATGSDGTHLGGNEAVTNYGTVTGSVDLGAGTNSFSNLTGANFNAGSIASVGAGNLFSNAGTFSPGGNAKAMTTALTGNLVQASTGSYAFNIDFQQKTADRLDIAGTASLAGKATLVPLNAGYAIGTQQYTILTTTGGASHGTLTLDAPASAVASYSLLYPNANDVAIQSVVSFAPAGLPQNDLSIANAVNRLVAAGNAAFAPIAAYLFGLPDTTSLINAYNALGGGGTTATQQGAFNTNSQFNNTFIEQGSAWFSGNESGVIFSTEPMQYAASRKKKRATDAFAQFERKPQTQPDRWHVWSSAFGAWQTVAGDSSAGTAGFRQSTYGMTVGVDRQVNRDFLFGVALGASRGTFSVPDRSTSGSAEGAHLGIYTMYRQNPFYIASSLGYAHFNNSTTRVIAGVGPTETANGEFGSNQFSARIETGRRSLIGRYVVTPFAGFELAVLAQDSYSETSFLNSSPSTPGTLGLTYQAQTTTSAKSSLGAQVESSYSMPNGMTLLPFARLAWVHEFNPNRDITAAFNVASSVPFVTSGAQAASDTGRINAGLNLQTNPAASLFLSFSGEFASGSQFYGVNGGYRIGW